MMLGLCLVLNVQAKSEVEASGPPDIATESDLTVNSGDIKISPVDPADVIDQVKSAKDFGELIGLDGAIMMALMVIFGYLSKFIPFFNQIDSTTYRVATIAIVIIVGFVMFGSSIWSGVISYVFSTSAYELIFKLFKKTPEVAV